jgi:hypothetical protein
MRWACSRATLTTMPHVRLGTAPHPSRSTRSCTPSSRAMRSMLAADRCRVRPLATAIPPVPRVACPTVAGRGARMPYTGAVRANSSAAERLPYTQEGAGSNPASPTKALGVQRGGLSAGGWRAAAQADGCRLGTGMGQLRRCLDNTCHSAKSVRGPGTFALDGTSREAAGHARARPLPLGRGGPREGGHAPAHGTAVIAATVAK